jgi:branched-chain amino acid transport system substrate-binding protein
MVTRRALVVAAVVLAATLVVAAAPRPTVRIGLFLPAVGEPADEARGIEAGARLAADEVNAAHGGTVAIEIVVRRSDGQWATGSRELVNLAYQDGATAVIGALDGRRAHLAAQIVTRGAGRFLFFTLANERTVTQVHVPWVFRLVPIDSVEAAALVAAIRADAAAATIALVAPTRDYDADSLTAQVQAAASPQRTELVPFDDTPDGRSGAAERLARLHPGAVVIVGPPAAAGRMTARIGERRIGAALYGPSRLACPAFLAAAGAAAEGMRILSPTPNADPGPGAVARARFDGSRGSAALASLPPLAAVAYDAVHALADAAGRNGSEPRALVRALHARTFPGVTGPLAFDRSGNRLVTPTLLVVRNGGVVRRTLTPAH